MANINYNGALISPDGSIEVTKIIDCSGSCGTAGQVLSSTGGTALEWITAGGGGGSPATPTAEGIVFGCTTSSSSNISLGYNTLISNTTGDFNTAVGFASLNNNLTADRNTAIGYNSLCENVSGSSNVAIGDTALPLNVSGCYNTAIGALSGGALTTGCRNVAIGACTSFPSGTDSCQLVIGWDTGCWLTGCSTGAIRPAAGIMDCTGSTGTSGQVLTSNGANGVAWGGLTWRTCTFSTSSTTPVNVFTAPTATTTGFWVISNGNIPASATTSSLVDVVTMTPTISRGTFNQVNNPSAAYTTATISAGGNFIYRITPASANPSTFKVVYLIL